MHVHAINLLQEVLNMDFQRDLYVPSPQKHSWYDKHLFLHVQLSVTPWNTAHHFCPPLSPGVWSDSCPLSRWCHPTISSSVIPFSSCPQSFPASGSFTVSGLFASGGQSSGVSTSASVLPMNIQGWFPLRFLGYISQNHTAVGPSQLWPQIRVEESGATSPLLLCLSPPCSPPAFFLRSPLPSEDGPPLHLHCIQFLVLRRLMCWAGKDAGERTGRYQAQIPAARFCLLCPHACRSTPTRSLDLRASRLQSCFIESLPTPWLQPGSLSSLILWPRYSVGVKPCPPVWTWQPAALDRSPQQPHIPARCWNEATEVCLPVSEVMSLHFLCSHLVRYFCECRAKGAVETQHLVLSWQEIWWLLLNHRILIFVFYSELFKQKRIVKTIKQK